MKKYGIAVTVDTGHDLLTVIDVLEASTLHTDDERDTLGKSGVLPGSFEIGDALPTDRQYGVIDCAMKVLPGAIRAVLAELESAGLIRSAVVEPFCEDDTIPDDVTTTMAADEPQEEE